MNIKRLNKLYAAWCKRSNTSYVKYLRKHGASIGNNTFFMNSRKASIDSGRIKYLTIGSNCVFGAEISIIMHDYSWYVLANRYGNLYPSGGKPVTIGDNVFVGSRSTILGGTTIGSNVIIGAGSVITGLIESDSVYAGVPAKRIMSLDEYLEKKKKSFIKNAFSEVDYYVRKFDRLPSENEMRNYAVLFADRNKNHTALGFEEGKYQKLLESVPAEFDDYNAFLQKYNELYNH